jgi:cell pole-organizing protein PopZ
VGFDPAPAPPAAPGDARSIDDPAPASETSAAHDDERGRLVSSATSAAVDSAFNALAQTVLVHNARTLEDLVREMLRPMLKVWLDDNLPGMVERLVRAEIERVSRGR